VQYFGKFGKIEFINMIKDHFTGSPRGFAFITFTNVDAVEDVLKENTHTINGSVCGSYRAKPRNGRLFDGNLNNKIKDTDIYDYFGQFGKIIRIERSSVPSKSMWFCFVVYQSMDTVKKVLQSEKPVLKNQELNVELARRRTRQSWWVSSEAPKREASFKRAERDAQATKTIFIGGLSSETDERDLKMYFEDFGKVESVNIVQDRMTQCSRGFGFVDFENAESVEQVLQMRTHNINGKSCGTRKVERGARKMMKVKPPGVREAGSNAGMFSYNMMPQHGAAPMLPPEIMQQMMPAGVSFPPENLPWEVQGLPWQYRPWW
jgi:RNA recognition motif-containing protein